MALNPNERKDVRRAEKLAAQREAARVAYTQHIMSTVDGRGWMHAHLEQCNVFRSPFVRGSADLTAFNCGSQNVGYQLFLDVVNNCPTEYILMMQEAHAKEIAHGRRVPESTDASADGN